VKKKKTLKAKIISNNRIAPDHFVMELESAYLAKNSRPGQFVLVKVQENVTDPLLRIPLGVHKVRKKSIHLLYKVVGAGTELLHSREKGAMLSVLGPLGNGFDLSPLIKVKGKNARAILIAGGHGIAPLYALAEAAKKKTGKIDFFTGACAKKHVLCVRELKKLGTKTYIATEDGTCGCKGYVTEPLRKYLEKNKQDLEDAAIYACGPRPMLAAVAKEAEKYKVPAQVSLDAYMACGIGTCLGCAIETTGGYKLVCKDGPVFDAQEIRWDKVQ
jgi:dihydroorotate dehydrogenase electron transfer subunit